MKSKDQLLLEQAYQQVREGMWDKAKEFINKNVIQYDTNAPGGEAREQEKAALPYKNFINAVVKTLSNGECQPPDPNQTAGRPAHEAPERYLVYVMRTAESYKISGVDEVWDLLFARNGSTNIDHPIAKALISAYNPETMRDKTVRGEPDDFEAKARGQSLRDQQNFAAQRRQAMGQ